MMKTKNNMKHPFLITFLSVFLISLTFSCQKKNKSKDTGSCNSNIICYTGEPDQLYVTLELSPSQNNLPIEVKFYSGSIDKGNLLDAFTTLASSETYIVKVDKTYSATAKYVTDGDTVIVVDSGHLATSYCTDNDTKCYDWDHELALDLKLKE